MKTILRRTLFLSFILILTSSVSSDSDYFSDNIGIQLYSLRNQFKDDIPGTLSQISEWGIKVIEGGDSYGMDEDKFITLLKKYNLETVSVGAGYDELENSLEKVVEKAKKYGAKYAMCPWIPHNDNEFTIDNTQRAIQVFNKAGKILKEDGIDLVYHPHGYEFRPYKEGTLFDVMAANANYFDFQMDVFWVQHGGEDPLKLLEKYSTKFKTFHLKDMKKGTVGNNSGHEDVETNVTLGTGTIDIKNLVLRGRELGVEYMFLEDESSNVVQQVPESLSYLKEVLKK